MVKSDNIFSIRARGGNLIFCQRNGKTYVKRYSGGFALATTQKPPQYKSESRTVCVRDVKNLKHELLPYLWRKKDGIPVVAVSSILEKLVSLTGWLLKILVSIFLMKCLVLTDC